MQERKKLARKAVRSAKTGNRKLGPRQLRCLIHFTILPLVWQTVHLGAEGTQALKILQDPGLDLLSHDRVLSSVKWAAFGSVFRGCVEEAETLARAMSHTP